jgi:hypothetical protein
MRLFTVAAVAVAALVPAAPAFALDPEPGCAYVVVYDPTGAELRVSLCPNDTLPVSIFKDVPCSTTSVAGVNVCLPPPNFP